ncbi:MAG TPA: GDP-mannose 4,6-dehydratase, partial [Dehalococcoidia bacterium]|nr:GDP-mannose 4,6-dehydratase [Dehalococcoidia bacterium]
PIPLYWNGEQVRDFIYVEDLARAHVVPLGLGGLNVYNVGTGRGVRVRHVVETIFAILGYETPIEDLGPRPGDVDAYWASPEKITAELGWRAEIDLAEGLRRTVDFFRSRLGG